MAAVKFWEVIQPSRSRGAVLLLTLGYLLYLPFSGYTHLHNDAQTYWDLATRFITPDRHFSLFYYSAGSRGYAWPLLLVPLRTAWKVLGGAPIWYTRLLGALVAGLVFGWLGPRLYQRLTGAAVLPSAGRRAAFALVGFACWRDYFNFPLTDFPALLALGSAMLLVLRPRLGWAGRIGVGLLLGLALNLRPIYQLSAGLVGLAALWPPAPGRRGGVGTPAGGAGLAAETKSGRWRRAAGGALALLLGLGLALGPQFLMHRRWFPQESAWRHLGGNVHQDELVARHLAMGLATFKYETNVGTDYPKMRVWYPDPQGQAFLRREQPAGSFATQSQYWALVRRYPLAFAGRYLRRLFDGLDVQYPTPYVLHVYRPLSWPLALLNYAVLLLGLARILQAAWAGARPDARRALLLLALLLPALASLPMAVEVRFLLPLHLLLTAAATLGWPENAAISQALRARPGRAALLAGLLGLALLECFRVSADTRAHLEYGARRLSGERRPAAGEPIRMSW